MAQSFSLDSIQINRIAHVSQLWGHLKYFHPDLDDGQLDWEGAFAEHIIGVIEAENTNQYKAAVQAMLERLNDPATRILHAEQPYAQIDSLKYPIVETLEEDILLLSIREYNDLEDFNYARSQFATFAQQLPSSSGAIIDLRSSHPLGEYGGGLSWFFAGIEGDFSADPVSFPGLQGRYHDGFQPENGATSGGYSSGVFTKDLKIINPTSNASDKPIVFLVNKHSEIPQVALALQIAGKAEILSVGPISDQSIVQTVFLDMGEKVMASLRQNSLPDGIVLQADQILPLGTGEEEARAVARELLTEKKGPHVQDIAQNIQVSRKEEENKSQGKESETSYPELGYRLLAGAKIWSVIHYFFAYQDLMEDDWDEVLKMYIPRFAEAQDSLEYALAVAQMYSHIQDGHGFIRSSTLSNYWGTAPPPIKIRFIEDQVTVVGILPDSIYEVEGVEIGDVVLRMDGEPIQTRFEEMATYTAASNPSWLASVISRQLLNGEDSSQTQLTLKKQNGSTTDVSLLRSNDFNRHLYALGSDRNGEAIIRKLNSEIGYADLDRLTVDMCDQMFRDFKDTKAIIFDMRGYPNGTAWTIAPHLTDQQSVPAASFRRYSPMGIHSGSSKQMNFFDQFIPPPQLPYYQGKTVMLIDERTISQAEHTGLFFEAANGTTFIGSQTAGANGDVTNFSIPGNISLFFSGHDVRHQDGRQLQQIGLVPDLAVKPTVQGIRDGRDEVLEAAVVYVEKLIKE